MPYHKTKVLLLTLALSACAVRKSIEDGQGSAVQSEVDSFTPRITEVTPEAAKAALKQLDDVTNAYLKDAITWANSQPQCESRCMAMIVSETLARTQPRSEAENRLKDIRAGTPYRRWGRLPPLPGWRGFLGEIEHLLSKGKTADQRYSIDQGIIRLPLDESVFQDIGRLDSPGSHLEVGALLPIDPGGQKPRLYIGSDKFGHFLSTGFEYLEAYLETYDESIAAGLTTKEAKDRAEFAMYVRGLLTEVTSLGGWLARVFSYGDLSANHAGYLFFQDIYQQRSPYLKQDKVSGRWSLGERRFAWLDFVEASWDEGQNCSHYFAPVNGGNHFAQKIVSELVTLEAKHQQRFFCPISGPVCQELAASTEQRFGRANREALVSPQCLDVTQGKAPLTLQASDSKKSEKELNALGFYSGEYVTEAARAWCRKGRDALYEERCRQKGLSAKECPSKLKKVTSEAFRCAMDTQDFLGWSF